MNSVEAGVRWEIRRGIIPIDLADNASAEVLDMVTSSVPYVETADLPWLCGVSVFNVNCWDPDTHTYGDAVAGQETISGTGDFPIFREVVIAISDAVPELENGKNNPDQRPGDTVNVNVYETLSVLDEHQDDFASVRVAVGLSGLARVVMTDASMYPKRIKTVLNPTDALILFNEDDVPNNAPHRVENISPLNLRVSLVL